MFYFLDRASGYIYSAPCEGTKLWLPERDQKGSFERVHVVGLLILEEFCKEHGDVRTAVDSWVREATEATWKTPAEVKARYASASFLEDNRVIFNIKGNSYRLETKIAYQTGTVLVKRMGTHAEYDRWN